MKALSFWKDERGFTIQELMVNLIIGSILVSLSFSIFQFGHKLFLSWQKKSILQTSVTRSINQVTLDILNSNRIVKITDSSLVLAKNTDRIVRYRFDHRSVWRDDILVTPNTDLAIDLSISKVTKPPDGIPEAIHLKIVGKTSSSTYTSETEIMPPRSSKRQFIATMAGN